MKCKVHCVVIKETAKIYAASVNHKTLHQKIHTIKITKKRNPVATGELMKRFFDYLKQGLAVGVIFISVILFIELLEKYGLDEILMTWIAAQEGWAGLAFVLICALFYSIAFSANILGAIAYILFGPFEGFLLYTTAGVFSSIGTFFFTRFIFFRPFQRWMRKKPHLQNVQGALKNKGTPFLCLIRFLPVHAAIINILMALSPIRFYQFFISLCSMIPQWLLFVYFGYCATEAANATGDALSAPNIIRYISIAIFIFILVYVSRQVQQTIKESQAIDSASA